MNNPQGSNPQPLDQIRIGIDNLVSEVKSTRKQHENDNWPKIAGYAAVVYTFITFLILFVSGYQAYLSRQALIAVQRAFIVAEVPTVHSISINDQMKWRIRPSWRNSGTTLALRATLAFQCAHTDSGSPGSIFIYAKDSIIEDNVIASQSVSVTGGFTLEQTSVDDIIAKKFRMFCYGTSVYRDIFSIKRTTKFCFEFLGLESGAPGVLTAAIWGTCPWRYACTDDQCKNSR